uniref:BAR/IMD domain containing adaptor protein 2 like 2 n=1 Tax=Homo sapiens TaxID=9606 RepID=A0A7P0Z4P0_HUMAN
MAPEMDQFYRSTMAIYKSIMEQFNPALENLVYLGNNYLRAFHALSEAAEVYFSAIQKIGERALQSPTSQILGADIPWRPAAAHGEEHQAGHAVHQRQPPAL